VGAVTKNMEKTNRYHNDYSAIQYKFINQSKKADIVNFYINDEFKLLLLGLSVRRFDPTVWKTCLRLVMED
jgi:hypothetical protein